MVNHWCPFKQCWIVNTCVIVLLLANNMILNGSLFFYHPSRSIEYTQRKNYRINIINPVWSNSINDKEHCVIFVHRLPSSTIIPSREALIFNLSQCIQLGKYQTKDLASVRLQQRDRNKWEVWDARDLVFTELQVFRRSHSSVVLFPHLMQSHLLQFVPRGENCHCITLLLWSNQCSNIFPFCEEQHRSKVHPSESIY